MSLTRPLLATEIAALLSPAVVRRFQAKLALIGKCWEYQGALSSRGYGQFSFKIPVPLTISAHKAAFVMENRRDIIPGMNLLHSCDNPVCCNPEHVSEGTHARNMQDRHIRGRYPSRYVSRGATDEIVKEIRRLYTPRVITQEALAQKFGFSRSYVNNILSGERCSDVS